MGMVSGVLNLSSNAVGVFRSIKNEQSAFKKDVESTSKAVQKTFDKKWNAKVETSAASTKVKSLRKQLEPLRKKVVTALVAKDAATAKVRSATAKVKDLGKLVASPVIKVKDQVSAGLGKISSKIKSMGKAVAIPLVAAATAGVMAVGATLGAGMQLEQQQVAMGHFIGATNKDMNQAQVQAATDEYTKALRENANATPFETGDVMAAGSRAVAISGGDTDSAMGLVTLAEDMAASSGGTKTISDAMEALADAKMGEMERLKEFGFKVSADEFQSKGFEGVTDDLDGFFGGAAEKMAGTGAGLLSTITGKLKSNVADVGLSMVEKMKPAFEQVIGFIDTMQPAFAAFGGFVAEGVGGAVSFLSGAMPQVIGFFDQFAPVVGSLGEVFSALGPVVMTTFGAIGSVVSQLAPVVVGVVGIIASGISAIAPVISTIISGIGDKIGAVASFLGGNMGFLQEAFGAAFSGISSVLSTAWNIIGPIIDIAISVFKLLFNVVKAAFPGIKGVISDVWNFLQPIFEGLGTALGWVADGIGWLADTVGGWFGGGEAEAPVVDATKPAAGSSPVVAGTDAIAPAASSMVAPASAGAAPAGPTGGETDPVSVDINWDEFPPPDPGNPDPYGGGGGGAGGMAMAPVPADMAATPMAVQPVEQHIDQSVTVTLSSLAGSITIKEEVDIDAVAARVVDQVTTAIQNTQAVPTPA